MDTQQLHAFIAVAESSSFSVAAERLHLTQPAVSKRVSLLEEQLGSQLFNRIGRKVELTDTGHFLLSKARLILAEVTATERAIADLNGTVEGKLSIAVSHHLGLHYLPEYLRNFSRRYPQVKLDLHFLDSEFAYHEITQGRFDLAVITLALEPDPRCESVALWHDQLHFVVARNHFLASQSSLRLADLSQYPAIMPDTSTSTTLLIKQLFDEQKLSLDIRTVSNHLDTIKMLITIGLGWGVLPNRLIDSQLHRLVLDHQPIERRLGYVHHKQRTLSNAARAFIQILTQIEE
jgi:DNA-binding transcriptional LysR family regulator